MNLSGLWGFGYNAAALHAGATAAGRSILLSLQVIDAPLTSICETVILIAITA